MAKKYNIIEVVEASAVAGNTIFPKDTVITFYNDPSKIKLGDGKTPFNSLPAIGGGAISPDVQAALDAKVDKTTTVAGKALSSNVTLVKADVGLNLVDNTADASKSVLSAATLTTGRTFSLTGGATGTSAAFNGSANASIAVTLATPTGAVKGGVLQATAQANSVAADVATLVTDFNALLAKLRTSGILAP